MNTSLIDAQNELGRQQTNWILNFPHRKEDGVACKGLGSVYELMHDKGIMNKFQDLVCAADSVFMICRADEILYDAGRQEFPVSA